MSKKAGSCLLLNMSCIRKRLFSSNATKRILLMKCGFEYQEDCNHEEFSNMPFDREKGLLLFPPRPLRRQTTYYWKIVAIDENGAKTEGPVWSFATGNRCRYGY